MTVAVGLIGTPPVVAVAHTPLNRNRHLPPLQMGVLDLHTLCMVHSTFLTFLALRREGKRRGDTPPRCRSAFRIVLKRECYPTTRTLVACGPFWPCDCSYSTFAPSFRDL